MGYTTAANVEPWTGRMRHRIARAVRWCRAVAAAIEDGEYRGEPVEVPTRIKVRRGVWMKSPPKALRVTAGELLRGDCKATEPALLHVSQYYEALEPHLPDSLKFDTDD
jgi:hypothetical protein